MKPYWTWVPGFKGRLIQSTHAYLFTFFCRSLLEWWASWILKMVSVLINRDSSKLRCILLAMCYVQVCIPLPFLRYSRTILLFRSRAWSYNHEDGRLVVLHITNFSSRPRSTARPSRWICFFGWPFFYLPESSSASSIVPYVSLFRALHFLSTDFLPFSVFVIDRFEFRCGWFY